MKPRTGAERFFAEQMKDPEYAAAFGAASARIDEIDKILGFLDQVRADQDLSKAELARRAGVPPETVRRLFTADHRNPTLDIILALSHALGVELFQFPNEVSQPA